MLNIKQQVKQLTISPDELTDELLTSTTPLIFKGLVKDWPLVKASQSCDIEVIDYIKRFYNQNPVKAMIAPANVAGRFFYNETLDGFNYTRKTTQLDTVLDQIAAAANDDKSDSYYVGSASINHIMPELRKHNDIDKLSDKPIVSAWIGNQSRIAAHYDVTDNVACVAAGKRRFTLFPPDQLDNLYIGPIDLTPAGQPASLVDFENVDFDQFPKFNTALEHAQLAELEAGDAIFIPSMWWHHVEGLSDINVLVNYWWRQVDHFLGAPMDALNHALLAIKDLPKEQRNAWRDIFEHYVFDPKEATHIPQQQRGVLNPIDELTARKLRAILLNKLNR
ncbi:cupin-like domain-containing protein [Thalassomonas sp. M1454]|uniref:cupin-like domain-containing protein n=1 Tax=Thalassomonas sp. M1454 TaxID=2594477 RepID=UPI00117F40F0|nr:cupin-like domain-containing protein [Thalassomonas sp. M1454]TRX52844.1 cupin-like domain-containing protein [Thalassomonas sp. M1454]